ncbi:Putative phosphoethanolamine transferase ybiP [Cedecea neteri]|uniref:Phosphoethanolamine transferase ybiP n=1 Tax=Cedecea neteri TaxID=158822 RepID=A0A2X2T1Z3_9ENTR|nr:Putative phosphoethanolamine transferase ybiP [Cedecea neteri]
MNPWAGFYFLQSLLINFALGYAFSLIYAIAFSCVLMLLWRTAPRAQKALLGLCSLVAAMYFPFGQAYGSPNFNTLLALHSTNFEESTEIMTIFPWYSYVVSLFILALGVMALRRKREEKTSLGSFR